MANREIKHTIRLDGEREYNEALRTAQRHLRTLRSELKAETAELGANATAQQKNETRAKSLQKQIAEQEKIVEVLRKALEQAKAQYGDNEVVVQQWEQRLNDARATLGNMRNDLSGLEQSYSDVNQATEMGVVATKSFADSVQAIAGVGESVSTAIENIFQSLVDHVNDIVVDLWDLISETATKADAYGDIAGYWNTDPAKIQQWSNALSASGKELSAFQTIVTRLNLGGKNKEITEMLGISDVNYTDQWDYAVAVMNRLSELQKEGNVPDNFWETVFGEKKAVGAIELVNSWDTILSHLEEFDADKGGFGMSTEELTQMAEVFGEIQEAQTKFQALKDEIGAGLGTIALDLLINVNGGLDAINDILNANTQEEREAAVQKLEENVKELFQKVADAIKTGVEVLGQVGEEMSSSEDPVVKAVGEVMAGIANVLQWFIDNQDAAKAALEAVFGAWLIAKLTAVAGQLTGIIAQIAVIKTFAASGGVEAAGAAAAETAAGAGVGGGAAASAGTSAAAAGGSAVVGAGALAAFIIAFKKAADERKNNTTIRGSVGAIEQEAEDSVDLQRAFVDYIEAERALQEQLDTDFTADNVESLAANVEAAKELFNSLEGHDDVMDQYSAWRQENSYGNMDWVLPDNLFGTTPETVVNTVLSDTDQARIDGIKSGVNDVVSGLDGLPAHLSSIITKAISGITLTMDGQTVGNIVAPYVSTGIAQQSIMVRY